MLQPLVIQQGLETLLTSKLCPADIALIVLNESGAIYAQTHLSQSANAKEENERQSEEQQRQQPRRSGLTSLMGTQSARNIDKADENPTLSNTSNIPMAITLTPDERARVLAGTACQAWIEEVARVRRLRATASGRFSAMASSSGPSFASAGDASSAGGMVRGIRPFPPVRATNNQKTNSVNGEDGLSALNAGSMNTSDSNLAATGALRRSRIEDEATGEEEEEGIAMPMAVLGTPLRSDAGGPGVAPLLLEGELGATLVLPLLPQAALSGNGSQSPPFAPLMPAQSNLLLVLSARSEANQFTPTQTGLALGNSILSQHQWNQMHDCAQSFANFIAPALQKALGRSGELLTEGHPGIVPAGGGTIFSDDRESLASAEVSHA